MYFMNIKLVFLRAGTKIFTIISDLQQTNITHELTITLQKKINKQIERMICWRHCTTTKIVPTNKTMLLCKGQAYLNAASSPISIGGWVSLSVFSSGWYMHVLVQPPSVQALFIINRCTFISIGAFNLFEDFKSCNLTKNVTSEGLCILYKHVKQLLMLHLTTDQCKHNYIVHILIVCSRKACTAWLN